ncbi:MAG: 2-oxo acid dehydrogenase subunit E2 [Acholeplasmataceae bacterium]|nr:2-oxo acid dehydrogenase subunit E2 [Acholeplasmataceae bacterium]
MMVSEVLMPKQGNTVESCLLSEWHVKEGDHVVKGTRLFSYETDKAAFDYDAEDEGIVLKVLYRAGDVIDVLKPVCYIGDEGEILPDQGGEITDEPVNIVQSKEEPTKSTPQKSGLEPNPSPRDGRIAVSPRARTLAGKRGIDPTIIAGTGPNGRVIERDVIGFYPDRIDQKQGHDQNEDQYTVKGLSNMRRLIGRSMTESLQSSAQLTHTISYDATDVLHYHQMLKARANNEDIPRITLNDIIVFAVSRVLGSHEDLNAHYVEDSLKVFAHVHIGIATDTPRGLMVPTLKQADVMSLVEIATNSKDLQAKALTGKINPDLLKNGSFTISNLGALGIEHFTPILNPPQTGILGVNTITTRLKAGAGQSFSIYQAMGLSLTYDHRAVDGAGASRFLKDLKTYLESFSKEIEMDTLGLQGEKR